MKGSDEISELAHNYNYMPEQLERYARLQFQSGAALSGPDLCFILFIRAKPEAHQLVSFHFLYLYGPAHHCLCRPIGIIELLNMYTFIFDLFLCQINRIDFTKQKAVDLQGQLFFLMGIWIQNAQDTAVSTLGTLKAGCQKAILRGGSSQMVGQHAVPIELGTAEGI